MELRIPTGWPTSLQGPDKFGRLTLVARASAISHQPLAFSLSDVAFACSTGAAAYAGGHMAALSMSVILSLRRASASNLSAAFCLIKA